METFYHARQQKARGIHTEAVRRLAMARQAEAEEKLFAFTGGSQKIWIDTTKADVKKQIFIDYFIKKLKSV